MTNKSLSKSMKLYETNINTIKNKYEKYMNNK